MHNRNELKKIYLSFVLFFAVGWAPGRILAQEVKAEEVKAGTSAIWGRIDGVVIEGVVAGPSTEAAPLQVACVFEYTEGDIFKSPPALPPAANGMVHLDQALNGIITALRKAGKFTGHAYETLLLTPPPGTIAARRLLLIGLGDRNTFSPELMITVSSVAMREALRLGVPSFAFASDLKDAGIESPTALVAEYEVKGAFDAYRTQQALKRQKMSDFQPLHKMKLLAGAAFFTTAGQGIRKAIASYR